MIAPNKTSLLLLLSLLCCVVSVNGVDGLRRAGSGEPCSSSSSVDDSGIATDTAAALLLAAASMEKPKVKSMARIHKTFLQDFPL